MAKAEFDRGTGFTTLSLHPPASTSCYFLNFRAVLQLDLLCNPGIAWMPNEDHSGVEFG